MVFSRSIISPGLYASDDSHGHRRDTDTRGESLWSVISSGDDSRSREILVPNRSLDFARDDRNHGFSYNSLNYSCTFLTHIRDHR